MTRAAPIFLLKVVVSLGLLAFFLSTIDLSDFLGVLASAQVSYLIVALVAYFFSQIISSFRWALLARALGFKNPLTDFAAFYFIGMFFNLFAPSTVGGDVGRVFYLSRGGSREKDARRAGSVGFATISVLADRAIGMGVLIWIGAVTLAAFPGYAIPAAIRYATFALALAFLLGGVSLPLINRLFHSRDGALWKSLGDALQVYRDRSRVIVRTALLSLAVHFLQGWMQVLMGRALAAEIPWSYGFIIYPLVGTFSALPISLNGIGLREGGYLFLLPLIGVSSEKAVAFGLLWFLIVALDSLVGGLVFILRRNAPAAERDHVR